MYSSPENSMLTRPEKRRREVSRLSLYCAYLMIEFIDSWADSDDRSHNKV